MSIRVFGIKNCDSMKKAFTWLEAQKIEYEFIDYKKAGVVETHVNDWLQREGWKTLLNTRGTTWRKLSDEEKADVDESKARALMIQYPTLIKRPVLDTGTALLIGFDADEYSKRLK